MGAVLAAGALALVAGCGSGSQAPSGDQRACRYYSIWMHDGGASQNFGGYTSLLDKAENSALKAASPQARTAIADGEYHVPGGAPGRLARDISFVQGDAEGDISAPAGWGDEVAAVQTDCAGL